MQARVKKKEIKRIELFEAIQCPLNSVIICHLIQYAVHTFGEEVYGLDWRTFSLSRCSCRRGILVSSNGQPAVTNVAVVQKERKTVENGHA